MPRFLISSLLTCTHTTPTSPLIQPATSPSARYIILSEQETDAILSSAAECAEGECSIDDVTVLINELKEQQDVLQKRLDKVMNMIAHLQHVNEKEERKTDEVRAFVKDMLRVFAHEEPKVNPTGFSGDIGKGPMTAFDALPPKKWKPSA